MQMLYKFSKNGVAIVLLIASLLQLDIDELFAEQIVTAIMLLASVGMMIWNQVSRRDVAKFFFRR
jgi:hypothetical protein